MKATYYEFPKSLELTDLPSVGTIKHTRYEEGGVKYLICVEAEQVKYIHEDVHGREIKVGDWVRTISGKFPGRSGEVYSFKDQNLCSGLVVCFNQQNNYIANPINLEVYTRIYDVNGVEIKKEAKVLVEAIVSNTYDNYICLSTKTFTGTVNFAANPKDIRVSE